jgi:hypothetical protein
MLYQITVIVNNQKVFDFQVTDAYMTEADGIVTIARKTSDCAFERLLVASADANIVFACYPVPELKNVAFDANSLPSLQDEPQEKWYVYENTGQDNSCVDFCIYPYSRSFAILAYGTLQECKDFCTNLEKTYSIQRRK